MINLKIYVVSVSAKWYMVNASNLFTRILRDGCFIGARTLYGCPLWCYGMATLSAILNFCREWASYEIRKIAGCAWVGNAGNVFPPSRVSDRDMQPDPCVTHVPWCLPGSLTNGFLWRLWQGKRSRHSRRMRNPQFYISGKRPIYRLPVGSFIKWATPSHLYDITYYWRVLSSMHWLWTSPALRFQIYKWLCLV